MREMVTVKGKPMFFGVKNSRCGERGYTLIDLAMALTIFGLLLSGVATGARVYMKDKQIAQTREYTRVVANAIDNYVLEKGHFPCPAAINKQMSNADYGKSEVCATANSYNDVTKEVTPTVAAGAFDTARGLWGEIAEDSTTKFVVRGMVPFASLSLPEFYAYDAYGNRLQYAVTVSQTDEKGFINSNAGGITVTDSRSSGATLSNARKTNHYLVFSSGPGEEGAWSRYGVMVKPCGTGFDGENCNTATQSAARYTAARYSLADGANRFDDVVVAKSSKHKPLWKPTSTTSGNISAVEDKPVVIKSSVDSVAMTAPANAAALRMDVKGTAQSQQAQSPKYCLNSDGSRCFDSDELINETPSAFACPTGFIKSISGGRANCTSLSYTCPTHSASTPMYVRGFDSKGNIDCAPVNFTTNNPPPIVVARCGSSHLQLMQAQPTAGTLCQAGTSTSVIQSETKWDWNCEALSGGHPTNTVACWTYRQKAIVNGACGSANGTQVTSAPSSNLCSAGTASAVQGSGPWNWLCSSQNGGSNASCSASWRRAGQCGTANGVTVAAPPSSNLCAVGTASTVGGPNPYTWTCQGQNGGGDASCSSGPRTTVNGACGASNGGEFYTQPTSGLCTTGTQSGVVGTGPWTWSCVGAGIPQGSTANCSANRRENGVCGAANGQNMVSAPSGGSLCNSGTASAVGGSGPWTWNCTGINGGTSSSCSAQRQINASCGGSANTCGSGTSSGYSAGSCGGSATWTCNGANGGTNASCSSANGPCAVNGSCGGSANSCGSGTASGYSAGSCGGSQTWSCVGAHGGSTANCSIANAACAVGGSCGGSANSCNSGTASGYNAGSCGGSQTWSCVGSGGGGTANCSIANAACAVGGSCGGSANSCNSGTPSGYNAGSCGGSQTWSCVGSGGGGTANCSIANGACAVHGVCGSSGGCSSGSAINNNGAYCGNMTWQCQGSGGGGTASCTEYLGSCGGGGGGGCFTGTTEVIMADGSRKAIANLKKGDKLRGHTQTNAVVSNKPFYVRSILYRINDSKDAYVTANHPFYTKGGEWKALDAELARKEHPGMEITTLKVGDILIHEDGREVELKTFTPEDHGWLIVYNPSLDGDHTYYANDLLMHNLLNEYEQKH